ncbi:hypothetical protein C8J57DRAFT_172839 [Mycena rebaudengoi]|nr:hypothetical protein C8J57DRAFT_172839 [Mycena rebaudengoi]
MCSVLPCSRALALAQVLLTDNVVASTRCYAPRGPPHPPARLGWILACSYTPHTLTPPTSFPTCLPPTMTACAPLARHTRTSLRRSRAALPLPLTRDVLAPLTPLPATDDTIFAATTTTPVLRRSSTTSLDPGPCRYTYKPVPGAARGFLDGDDDDAEASYHYDEPSLAQHRAQCDVSAGLIFALSKSCHAETCRACLASLGLDSIATPTPREMKRGR